MSMSIPATGNELPESLITPLSVPPISMTKFVPEVRTPATTVMGVAPPLVAEVV